MPIPIRCPKCEKTAVAPEWAAGGSVACAECGATIPVPAIPVATLAGGQPARSPLPPDPSQAHTDGEMNVWLWRGLGIGAFVVICIIFAIIGAVSNPDAPGISASRMARKVGAPIALVLILAVEGVLWLIKWQRTKREESNRHP